MHSGSISLKTFPGNVSGGISLDILCMDRLSRKREPQKVTEVLILNNGVTDLFWAYAQTKSKKLALIWR